MNRQESWLWKTLRQNPKESVILIVILISFVVATGKYRQLALSLKMNSAEPRVEATVVTTERKEVVKAADVASGVNETDVIVKGKVVIYTPGALIAVIEPQSSTVDQVIMSEPAVMLAGRNMDPGNTVEARGALDALNRLVAKEIKVTKGVSVQPTQPQVTANPPSKKQCGQYHTVQRGETAFGIANRQYGISLAVLASGNPGKDLNRIFVGEVLYIPCP